MSARHDVVSSSVLTDEVLAGIRKRAPGYDQRNEFFHEDLDILRERGYLKPRSLSQMSSDQRRLAAHAPATALGLGMHLTWMGVARDMVKQGHDEFQWILDDGEAGELFAFGVSERGNDRVLSDSLVSVQEVEGGFSYTGQKIFVSLSPAWTRLSLLGKLGDDIIHGFITRDQKGWSNTPDWDTLGMRATQSYTTDLEGVVVEHSKVVRRVPVGPNDDPFTVAIFRTSCCWSPVCMPGIADRALELTVEGRPVNTAPWMMEPAMRMDPDIRRQAAASAIAVDALTPQLQTYCSWVDAGEQAPEHWFRLLSGMKHQSVETARRVVDTALRIVGGGAYRSSHELSRLQRDVLAGVYHPSDTEAVHRTVAFDLFGPTQ